MRGISVGLGLLSIGRRWGVHDGEPPPREAARALLDHAVGRGIRFFDTAPAYGSSESILGDFLREIGPRRADITIATKMGEHWIDATSDTRVDHSFDALRASIDESLRRLGRIDVMQVHKATKENMFSADVLAAIDYGRRKGIMTFGVSVSGVEAARLACESPIYSTLQFPFNRASPAMADMFALARRDRKMLLINRPFAMGGLIAGSGSKDAALVDALRFIREQEFDGCILTGTRSTAHLDETMQAFAASA